MTSQNDKTQNNSVYLSLKPVLIVCKILGSCCIQNIGTTEASLLYHRYFSFALLWSMLFHYGISYMMHATIELRRQKLAVTWFYDIRKWCFLFAVFVTERQRVQVIKELDEFDKSINHLNKTTLIISNNYRRGHIWLFVYKLIYGIGTDLVSYTLFYPKGKTVMALILDLVVKTFTAQLVFCYTVLYLTFAHEFCYRFTLITVSWQYHAKAFAENPTETVRSFEALRLFHSKLCAIAEKLASCYGLFFIINLFFVFLEMLVYLYRMVHISKNVFSNVQSIVFLAANVASLPALSIASSYITDAVSILFEIKCIFYQRIFFFSHMKCK